MMRTEWRFEVRLRSREALVSLMALQGYSVRTLAKRCDPKSEDRHRSAIGHLVSGRRKTCSAELARQIQEIVGSPKAPLFEGELYAVQRDGRTAGRAA